MSAAGIAGTGAAGLTADAPVPTAAAQTQRKKQKGATPTAAVLPSGAGHVPEAAPASQKLSKKQQKQQRRQQQQQSEAAAEQPTADPASQQPSQKQKLSKKQQQQQQVEAAADDLLAELDAEAQGASLKELLDIEAEHDSQSDSEDEDGSEADGSEQDADSEQGGDSEQEGSDLAGAQQLLGDSSEDEAAADDLLDSVSMEVCLICARCPHPQHLCLLGLPAACGNSIVIAAGDLKVTASAACKLSLTCHCRG